MNPPVTHIAATSTASSPAKTRRGHLVPHSRWNTPISAAQPSIRYPQKLTGRNTNTQSSPASTSMAHTAHFGWSLRFMGNPPSR